MTNIHFTFKELTASETAEKYGIDNIPQGIEYFALAALVRDILEPVRAFHDAPIFITSGYRSDRVNKLVGGAKNSQHKKGEAVDFTTGNKADNKSLYEWIKLNLEFDQLILENGGEWIHVSYIDAPFNRNQAFEK